MSFADLDAMAVPDILWLVRRMREQRQKEAEAIQKSVKSPRKR